jgi:predicted dehydrogenase
MLRGAVIGFGRMGITHFSILNTHPEVKMVAICDTHSIVRNNAAKYLKVESYDNYEKMLDEMDLQFAVVATPTATHKETVESALRRGLHVFVEKPFTLNPQQGNELVQLAKEAKVVNQIGYVFRFNDVFQEVKKLIDMGALGDLLTFKMEMNGPTVLHDAKSSWRFKKGEGGGCLYDFASHAIDLINYFIGPPDKVVGSVLQSIYSEHLEDFIITTYIYENGIRGSLLANWSDPSYRKVTTRFEILAEPVNRNETLFLRA